MATIMSFHFKAALPLSAQLRRSSTLAGISEADMPPRPPMADTGGKRPVCFHAVSARLGHSSTEASFS
jgi:hypothetical protein